MVTECTQVWEKNLQRALEREHVAKKQVDTLTETIEELQREAAVRERMLEANLSEMNADVLRLSSAMADGAMSEKEKKRRAIVHKARGVGGGREGGLLRLQRTAMPLRRRSALRICLLTLCPARATPATPANRCASTRSRVSSSPSPAARPPSPRPSWRVPLQPPFLPTPETLPLSSPCPDLTS